MALKAFAFQLLAVLLALAQCRARDPPPNMGRPFEKKTNLTMDELITGALGGVGVASNMFMADGTNILAELDMSLSEEQFLRMYAPPQPEDMVKMGMMPAPLGRSTHPHQDDAFQRDRADYPKLRTKRKATRDVRLRWTNGEVPYGFARGHFDKKEEYMMRRSMTEWERYTCLKFYPAEKRHHNSLRFQNGVGCNSQLGMVGGVQVLNLQAPGCRYKGLYLHEIGHALGLVHEHQLPDRDNYIRILYHNVSPHMRRWFNKYNSREVNQMSVAYEYSSVMHYGITAFAEDGESQTIEAKDKSMEKTIGRVYLKELGYSDVAIVNKMYNCSAQCSDPDRCGSDGHLDQNCNCICRDGSSDCDRTKGGVDRNCRNQYDSWACYIWANQGECERNQYYMGENCAKACGLCGTSSTPRHCKDNYKSTKCQVWKDRGDCVTNSRWMTDHCAFTCKLCDGNSPRPEENCQDIYSEAAKCLGWARDGECIVNRHFMFKNCRKSCHMCLEKEPHNNNTDTGIDEVDTKCENTHHNCESWARSGECETNPTWMVANCRKACRKCDDGTCKNLYQDTQCIIWSQKAECVTNSVWMATHCAKACGKGACKGQKPDKVTPKPSTSRPTVTSSRPTTTAGGADCKNKHSSDTECDIWAKNDHCSINPSWMLTNCHKSCNGCGDDGDDGDDKGDGDGNKDGDTDEGSASTCSDADTRCGVWARDGYCDSNPRYNLIFCQKSCNNCNGCRDADFLCGIWAGAGHCERNARYMLRHCQKSCNACHKSSALEELKPRGDNASSRPTVEMLWSILTLALIYCIR